MKACPHGTVCIIDGWADIRNSISTIMTTTTTCLSLSMPDEHRVARVTVPPNLRLSEGSRVSAECRLTVYAGIMNETGAIVASPAVPGTCIGLRL